MKIAFDFQTFRGGAPHSLREYARIAQEGGWDVVAITSSLENRRIVDEYGIRVVQAPRFLLHRPDLVIKNAAWYTHFITRESVSVIHAIHPHTFPLFAAIAAARPLSLIFTQATPSTKNPEAYWACPHAYWTTYCDEFVNNLLQRRIPRDRISKLPNRFNFHSTDVDWGSIPRSSGLKATLVGRLDSDKMGGVRALLDCYDAGHMNRLRMSLTVIGGGDGHKEVTSRANNINENFGSGTISLVGYVTSVARHARDCQIVIGMGRCIIDGLAAGRACVVLSDTGKGLHVTSSNFKALQQTNFTGRGIVLDEIADSLRSAAHSLTLPSADQTRKQLQALTFATYDVNAIRDTVMKLYGKRPANHRMSLLAAVLRLSLATISSATRHLGKRIKS